MRKPLSHLELYEIPLPSNGSTPKIINLILMLDFQTEINLRDFFDRFRDEHTILLPEDVQFPAAVIKMDVMSVLLFPNGKCICSGINEKKTTLIDEHGNLVLDPILNRVSVLVNDFTGESTVPQYRIVNLVTQMDLSRKIDLHSIVMHAQNCIYEPDIFPALILRTKSPPRTFLVFASGQVIAHLPHPQLNEHQKIRDLLSTMFTAVNTAIDPIN